MNALAEIEKFKDLILQRELPRRNLALFEVPCHYCGKTGRIQKIVRVR